MKINGKTSNLTGNVHIEKAKAKISITSDIPLSKRYTIQLNLVWFL